MTADIADVAAGFAASVTDVIAIKTQSALERTGAKTMVLGGGVASNSLIRSRLVALCETMGIALHIPSPVYCTDNAAMIACAAYYDYRAGRAADLSIDAVANLPL